MNVSPVIIVVAVGGASHFLEADPQGAASLLGATLANAMGSGLPVVVVTTEALAGEASRHLASRDVFVIQPRLDSAGPGRFERRGLNAIPGVGIAMALGVAARPNAPGWLVLPGDMPRVKATTLQQVGAALREHAAQRRRRGVEEERPQSLARVDEAPPAARADGALGIASPLRHTALRPDTRVGGAAGGCCRPWHPARCAGRRSSRYPVWAARPQAVRLPPSSAGGLSRCSRAPRCRARKWPAPPRCVEPDGVQPVLRRGSHLALCCTSRRVAVASAFVRRACAAPG